MNRIQRRITWVLSVAAVRLLQELLSGTPVSAGCTVPPASARFLDAELSEDSRFVSTWCTDSEVSSLWSSDFDIDADEWRDLGFRNACDLRYPVGRFLSSLFLVRETQRIGALQGGNRKRWWNYLRENEDSGFSPKCDEGGAVQPKAKHFPEPLDSSTNLYMNLFYEHSVPSRAMTLAHEAAHEYEGHTFAFRCDPDSPSCDVEFGEDNANTNGVWFAEDLLRTYETSPPGSGTLLSVRRSTSAEGEVSCRWVPLANDRNRNRLIDESNYILTNRFVYPAEEMVYADAAAVDRAHNPGWSCEGCRVEEFTYHIDRWSRALETRACNETVNPTNRAVNEHNRSLCSTHLAGIPSSPTEQEYLRSVNRFNASLRQCADPDPRALDAYCQSEIQDARHVMDIDPRGVFQEYSMSAGQRCVEDFCRLRTNYDLLEREYLHRDDWLVQYNPDGCMEALCGDDLTCRRRFVQYRGNPDFYLGRGTLSACTTEYLDCIDQSGEAFSLEEWPEYITADDSRRIGQGACKAQYDTCTYWTAAHQRLLNHLSRFKLMERAIGPLGKRMFVREKEAIRDISRQVPPGAAGLFAAEMDQFEAEYQRAPEDLAAIRKFHRWGSQGEIHYQYAQLAPAAYLATLASEIPLDKVSRVVGPLLSGVQAGLSQPASAEEKELQAEALRRQGIRKSHDARRLRDALRSAAHKSDRAGFLMLLQAFESAKSVEEVTRAAGAARARSNP